MKTKEEILNSNDFKQKFLLGWLRFLTYSELETYDLLNHYDDAVLSKQIKTPRDWDKQVLEFTEQNLLAGLCILMHKLYGVLVDKSAVLASIYALDVEHWLLILDDSEFKIDDDELSIVEIEKYYEKVAKKYKIEP